MSYPRGTRVTITGEYRTATGTLADPATARLRVTPPRQPERVFDWPTPGALTRVSAGLFSFEIVADVSGVWLGRWEGTDNGAPLSASPDFEIAVDRSSFS